MTIAVVVMAQLIVMLMVLILIFVIVMVIVMVVKIELVFAMVSVQSTNTICTERGVQTKFLTRARILFKTTIKKIVPEVRSAKSWIRIKQKMTAC